MFYDSGVFFALPTFFAGLAVVRFAFACGEREASNPVSTNFDIPAEHTFWGSPSEITLLFDSFAGQFPLLSILKATAATFF
jgi:hypothetical protein